MIKFENTEVMGWEAAIRGMRNPLESWEKSDSEYLRTEDGHIISSRFEIGPNDLNLMMRLQSAGTDHRKFLRMIVVYVDITAPFYWWKEFSTYKVGTVANSCSTMHCIHKHEFTLDDFSHEHLIDYCDGTEGNIDNHIFTAEDLMQFVIDTLNHYRLLYLDTKDKRYWWQMIQLLPSSYNQKRTVMLNYEVLANIYHSRLHHKLDEWSDKFCFWIESLPYSGLITGGADSEQV